MRASTFFAIFVAILLGLGTLGAARYFGWLRGTAPVAAPTKIEYPKVLVAKRNIYEGMAMTPADVQVRELTAEEAREYEKSPAKYMHPSLEAAALRVANISIPAGQILLKEYVEPMKIPEGLAPRLTPEMRAVHVSVPKDRAAGGLIRTDEYVDVLLTTAISGDKNNPMATTRTACIANNLRVILKRDMLWPMIQPVPENKPLQFTLEADPYRAALIEFARTRGELTLVPTPTPPLPKNATLKPPATFSIAGSKEYMNEDERVKALLRGDRTVGEADLERIFELPPLVVSDTVQVENLIGNKVKGVTQFSRPIALADRSPVNADQPGYGYRFGIPVVAVAEPGPGSPSMARPLNRPK